MLCIKIFQNITENIFNFNSEYENLYEKLYFIFDSGSGILKACYFNYSYMQS